MALTLGDNFSYQGAKPLDGRLKYDTLAAMKAVGDSTMYDGCLAYCSATDKTYQWKSTNTVDVDTGKWREFTSGGGGGEGHDSRLIVEQVTTLPSPSVELVGVTYEYVGATVNLFTNDDTQRVKGCFYTCVESSGTYKWTVSPLTHGSIYFNSDDFTSSYGASNPLGKWELQLNSVNTPRKTESSTMTDSDSFAVNVSGAPRRFTLTSLKAKLKTYFDDLYATAITIGAGLKQSGSTLSIKEFAEGDMDEVIPELPSVGVKSHKYSTTEQKVDTWIDGTPVYEITIYKTNQTIGTDWTYITTGMSNVSNIISLYGTLATSTDVYALSYGQASSYFIALGMDNNKTRLALKGGSSKTGVLIVTIRYTKTTD